MKINSELKPLLFIDVKIWEVFIGVTIDCRVCRIIIASTASSYILAEKVALYSIAFCPTALSWICWLHAGDHFCLTVHTMSLSFVYLWCALLAFSAKVPHRAGAPYSELVSKCQPLGGLSCPMVPQLATLPTLSLKALTFTRHHRAARGGVTFPMIFFFLSRGKRCALALAVRQRLHF